MKFSFRTLGFFKRLALSFSVAAFCYSCGENAKTAGTIIETNTGNKECSRVFISTAAISLRAGDTVFVSGHAYRKAVDSLAVVSGVMSLDSVPVGIYDSAEVHMANGELRTVAVKWESVKGEVFFDPALGSNSVGVLSLDLPKGFEDLAIASEIFENVPALFPVPAKIQGPCLLDRSGNLMRLDSHRKILGEDSLYWGVVPQAVFSDAGTLDFEIVENCQITNDIALSLGRHSEHFGEGALILDSVNASFVVPDFEPFVESRSTGVSLWIRADSSEQVHPYARILEARSDAGGFVIQRRGATGSVNIRIDTEEGSYNALFGRSAILDGSWRNYAFTLAGDSIHVYADGEKIQDAAFEQPGAFSDVCSPVFGSEELPLIGSIDEVIFLFGTESENWMRLFHALQKRVFR